MKPSQLMRIGIVIVAVSGGLLALTKLYPPASSPLPISLPAASGGLIISISPSASLENSLSSVSPVASESGTIKEFSVTAKDFSFDPAVLRVKKGDRVRIDLTSTDVAHGFALRDFGFDLKVEAGQTQSGEFTADKAGTFTFFCSVPCGSGHKDMTGTLIVEE